MSARDLKPPFNLETAHAKVKVAQALWNTTDPNKIVNAYSEHSIWRNRDEFFQGHQAIKEFLTRKWQKEERYRLRKELFAFTENKIAVQFWYEYYHEGQWFRCYGLEDWTFDEDGKMAKRQMSGNDIRISEEERWFKEHLSESDIDAVEIGPKHW